MKMRNAVAASKRLTRSMLCTGLSLLMAEQSRAERDHDPGVADEETPTVPPPRPNRLVQILAIAAANVTVRHGSIKPRRHLSIEQVVIPCK